MFISTSYQVFIQFSNVEVNEFPLSFSELTLVTLAFIVDPFHFVFYLIFYVVHFLPFLEGLKGDLITFVEHVKKGEFDSLSESNLVSEVTMKISTDIQCLGNETMKSHVCF